MRLAITALFFFFFNDTATTEIYTLSLHDALPISARSRDRAPPSPCPRARCGAPRSRGSGPARVGAPRAGHTPARGAAGQGASRSPRGGGPLMFVVPLIERKRDGGALTPEEWSALVAAYTAGRGPDYQMSAPLMAVYFRGLERPELAAL